MASYDRIYNIVVADSSLLNRMMVAVTKHAAYLKVYQAATQAQKDWAVRGLSEPRVIAQALMWEAVMNPIIGDAANTAGVTDQQVQDIVDAICEAY